MIHLPKHTLFSIGLLVAMILLFAVPALAEPPTQGGPPQEPSAERGAELWVPNCAPCHAVAGTGDGETATSMGFKAADFTDPQWAEAMTVEDVYQVVKVGRMDKFMPGWSQRLTEQEMWDVSAYALTLADAASAVEALPEDGILRGQILNGTTGQPQGGVDLTLYTLTADGQTLDTQPARSAEDGTFTFENLSRSHSQSYAIEGNYLNVSYFSSDTAIFVPGSQEAELNLTVYETTDDPAVVANSVLHRIISFDADQLGVADVYVFSNSSDRAFAGTPGADGLPATAKIGVPANAVGISFQSESIRMIEEGIYLDSEPVPPGEQSYTIFVTYFIPIDGRDLTLETPLFRDIEVVNALIADQGETVESPQLASLEPQDIQGATYYRLSGVNLPAAQPLVMEFGNLNKIQAPSAAPAPMSGAVANPGLIPAGPDQSFLLWLILGLGGLMLAFSLVYASRSPSSLVTQDALAREKARLLTLLAELEEQRQSGALDDQTYQRIRQKNRALLKQILAQLYD